MIKAITSKLTVEKEYILHEEHHLYVRERDGTLYTVIITNATGGEENDNFQLWLELTPANVNKPRRYSPTQYAATDVIARAEAKNLLTRAINGTLSYEED